MKTKINYFYYIISDCSMQTIFFFIFIRAISRMEIRQKASGPQWPRVFYSTKTTVFPLISTVAKVPKKHHEAFVDLYRSVVRNYA